MSFDVVLSSEAKANIVAISDYIAQDSTENALRWEDRLRERLRSLGHSPTAHEVAYRAEAVGREIRHTFFGVYRVLYTISGTRVVVLTVRHGARQPLSPDELRRIDVP
jgi:plasmid stabilization system protein ParE